MARLARESQLTIFLEFANCLMRHGLLFDNPVTARTRQHVEGKHTDAFLADIEISADEKSKTSNCISRRPVQDHRLNTLLNAFSEVQHPLYTRQSHDLNASEYFPTPIMPREVVFNA
jgi:hypothetical protein